MPTLRGLTLLTLFGISSGSALWAQDELTVAVVMDGPWERNTEIRETFETEISTLMTSIAPVRFPPDKRVEADWSNATIASAIDGLLEDPEVDILLALGPQSSNDVTHRGPLPKPVLAAFVINPELQGIPLSQQEGGRPTSGVSNLSYVVVGTDVDREIRLFREIRDFSVLTILTSRGLRDGIPELGGRLDDALAALEIEQLVVVVDRTAAEALEAIPATAEAVYVTPLLQLEPGEFDVLVAGLIERRLPTFSMWGRSEVERGILAALGLDLDYQRVARRIAVDVQRIALGEEPSTFPVDFERQERLTVNMATARAIDLYPSWALVTEAELLNQEQEATALEWTLASAVRQADMSNRDLRSALTSIDAGAERVRRARAELRPQLGLSGSATFIDEDRATASFGSAGRQTYAGGLNLTQILYSDRARGGRDVEERFQEGRVASAAEVRLDVVREAAVGYLRVLMSQTVERIQQSNLLLTRTHLELARAREQVGAGRASEVFRWENQIANNRRDVIEANAARNQTEIGLNRIMNRPLEEPFSTREATMDDAELRLSFARIGPYIDNFRAFDIFREFMVAEALAESPELRRLDAAIGAQERTLLSTERSFYLPDVQLQAQLSAIERVEAGGGLPTLPPGVIPSAGNVNWTVAVGASLPIFTSGAQSAERDRAQRELAGLRIDREAVRERVEQRVRSNLHAAMASFAGIELAEDAASAAESNLGLVTDAYSVGVLNVLDLLDAQNAALTARLLAANAVFAFLIDLMDVERAVGRFDFLVDPLEEPAFFERLDRFFENAGYPIQ